MSIYLDIFVPLVWRISGSPTEKVGNSENDKEMMIMKFSGEGRMTLHLDVLVW